MRIKESFHVGSNRGVSTTVGLILIMGFVVIAGLGTFVFAQNSINVEDPKADADFVIKAENTTGDLESRTGNETGKLEGQIVYARGSEFTSDNTEKLYIVGQTPSGTLINGSSGIVLYEDGNADLKENDNSTIDESDVVMSTETADSQEVQMFKSGSSAQVVWEPKGEEQEKIIDEFVVPDESIILQRTVTGGNFIKTDFRLNISNSRL